MKLLLCAEISERQIPKYRKVKSKINCKDQLKKPTLKINCKDQL